MVADCLSRPPEELSLSRDGSIGASSAVAVVAGVMAAPPLPAVVLSTPSCPTLEAPSSTVAGAVDPATQQGPISWEELGRDQLTCQETQGLLTSNTGLLVEMVVYQGAQLWCDTSTGAIRPLVPTTQRQAIFQQVHELSHAGRRATRRLAATCFVWPGLASDVVA